MIAAPAHGILDISEFDPIYHPFTKLCIDTKVTHSAQGEMMIKTQ
jgi:hypothetical protein